MSILGRNHPKAAGRVADRRQWQDKLESIAIVAGTRAEISLGVARAEKTVLARPLSAISYDADRDEIELRLGSVSGLAPGPRLYFAKPTYVGVKCAGGLTTLTVWDQRGSLTIVRLYDPGALPAEPMEELERSNALRRGRRPASVKPDPVGSST